MGCFLLLVIFVFISWSDLLIRDGYCREMILWYQGNRNEPFFLTMNCELLGAGWTFWELSWGEMFPTHKKNKWWVLFWIKEKDLLRVVRKETTQMSVESESVETTFIIIHHRPMSFMEDKVTCSGPQPLACCCGLVTGLCHHLLLWLTITRICIRKCFQILWNRICFVLPTPNSD